MSLLSTPEKDEEDGKKGEQGNKGGGCSIFRGVLEGKGIEEEGRRRGDRRGRLILDHFFYGCDAVVLWCCGGADDLKGEKGKGHAPSGWFLDKTT